MTKFTNGRGGAAGPLSDVEAAFYAAQDAAEVVRQVAVKAAATATNPTAAARAANLAYHQAVVSARTTALTSGAPGHLGAGSVQVLQAGEYGLS